MSSTSGSQRGCPTAKHPRSDRPYDQLTYQPQRQLLDYLRDNGFRTFIVSGGGADFTRFEIRNGTAVLVKTMDYVFVDDKAGKPSGIHDRQSAPEPWVLVHHTDAEREDASNANPPASGKLVTALQEARPRAWTVVDQGGRGMPCGASGANKRKT
jgi:hypothetical protein